MVAMADMMSMILVFLRPAATRALREPRPFRDSEQLKWPGSSMEERRSDKPQTEVQIFLGSPSRITGMWSNGATRRPFKPETAGSSPVIPTRNRDEVQFGRTPALGAGGRRFKSCHPDQSNGAVVQRIEFQTVDLEIGVQFPVVPPVGTRGLCRTRAHERNRGRYSPLTHACRGEKTLAGAQRGVARSIRHLSSKQVLGSRTATPVL
jgi:hypothetical protein